MKQPRKEAKLKENAFLTYCDVGRRMQVKQEKIDFAKNREKEKMMTYLASFDQSAKKNDSDTTTYSNQQVLNNENRSGDSYI